MAIPRTIKNYLVFCDGNSFAGKTTEIELPKLARKLESYRAGGMDGPISMDMGGEELALTFSLGERNASLLKKWGALDVKGVGLRFKAAAVSDNADGTTDAIEIAVNGRLSEIETDKIKAGERVDTKFSMKLAYYKEILNDETLIEIDQVNMKYVVNGVDLLEKQRAALGM